MIAPARSARCKKSPPAWHAAFEAMVPVIERQARIAFRHLNAQARQEAIQEVICNSCCAFARLAELNKTDVAYPSVLAGFGIRQTIEGRKIGTRLNVHDVTSEYCQRKKGLLVERLDCYDDETQAWAEILIEDKHVGPADTAITRIDFGSWLQLLPRHLRKIANFLANGESTGAAARRFRLSPGRISQIRRQLYEAWVAFQGEEGALATA